jgi:adenylate cyclase
VRRGGNRVRVTAQLIDAETGAHIWAERYDRDLTDIFAVQDEITASVAGIIEPALAQAEHQRIMRKPPERLDAWEAYQRGLFHCNKYGAEDNKIAQRFFRQAIALDPNFAPGHYGYVFALWMDTALYLSRPNAELLEAMLKEAPIAVALDDKDAMSHAALATALVMNGSFEAGLVEARAALALNPNNAQLIAIYGGALIHAGHPGEAIEPLRQAMRASPHDPLTWHWTHWIGMAQLCNGDFESSLETYRHLSAASGTFSRTSEHRRRTGSPWPTAGGAHGAGSPAGAIPRAASRVAAASAGSVVAQRLCASDRGPPPSRPAGGVRVHAPGNSKVGMAEPAGSIPIIRMAAVSA